MTKPKKKSQGTPEGRSRGGSNSGGNFKNDPERARAAGQKGGKASGGNFKNDPARASEAGRKGGLARSKVAGTILSCLILSLLILSGCSDADKGDWGSLGTAGHVTCYSGGQKIYEGNSTGKVMNHSDSNGYYFIEKDTKIFFDIQADCIVTHP